MARPKISPDGHVSRTYQASDLTVTLNGIPFPIHSLRIDSPGGQVDEFIGEAVEDPDLIETEGVEVQRERLLPEGSEPSK